MITCYIASPYTGEEINGVNRQIEYASMLIDAGLIPIVPLLSHYIHEQYPKNYETWMKIDFELIKKCDVVFRCPLPSPGADREEEYAVDQGKKVYYNIHDVIKDYGV